MFTSSNTGIITIECRRVGNLQIVTTRNITEIQSTSSIFLRCMDNYWQGTSNLTQIYIASYMYNVCSAQFMYMQQL